MFDMIDGEKVPTKNQEEREAREGRSGDRLTKEWTDTLVEAYGERGQKGEDGELFVKEALTTWGWLVKHYIKDREKQSAGIDLQFKSPRWANWYTADVKNNMDEYGSFYVDTDSSGWLFADTKTSDRIWHCNDTTGWMAWYGREEMKEYIIEKSLKNTGGLKIDVNVKLNFITRKKHEKTKVHMGDLPT